MAPPLPRPTTLDWQAFADFLDEHAMRRVFIYWDARRGGRRYPRFVDLDPANIMRHRPNAFLAEQMQDTRWRLRPFATGFRRIFSVTTGGVALDRLLVGGTLTRARATLNLVLRSGQPTYSEMLVRDQSGTSRSYRRLLLPLSDRSSAPAFCLGVHSMDIPGNGRDMPLSDFLGGMHDDEYVRYVTAQVPSPIPV